jgi:hypothetical protein
VRIGSAAVPFDGHRRSVPVRSPIAIYLGDYQAHGWRRRGESNPCTGLCRPVVGSASCLVRSYFSARLRRDGSTAGTDQRTTPVTHRHAAGGVRTELPSGGNGCYRRPAPRVTVSDGQLRRLPALVPAFAGTPSGAWARALWAGCSGTPIAASICPRSAFCRGWECRPPRVVIRRDE